MLNEYEYYLVEVTDRLGVPASDKCKKKKAFKQKNIVDSLTNVQKIL